MSRDIDVSIKPRYQCQAGLSRTWQSIYARRHDLCGWRRGGKNSRIGKADDGSSWENALAVDERVQLTKGGD